MISIIILNYNGWKDTIECVESVLRSDYESYRIVLVDNDSSNDSFIQLYNWITQYVNILRDGRLDRGYISYEDESLFNSDAYGDIQGAEWISENCPNITLLKTPKNGGYAYGNNIGILYSLRHRDVECFWILNNDTVVLQNTLTSLMDCYCAVGQSEKQIALFGSVQLFYDNPELVQAYAGGFNKWRGKLYNIGAKEIYNEYVFDDHFDYVYGAALLISRECIESVGFLSEEYFLYYEEIDYAHRIREKGYGMMICKYSVVLHKYSSSITKYSKWSSKDYYYKNMIVFYRKYYPYLLFVPFLKVIGNLFAYGAMSWSDAKYYLGVLKYYVRYMSSQN